MDAGTFVQQYLQPASSPLQLSDFINKIKFPNISYCFNRTL